MLNENFVKSFEAFKQDVILDLKSIKETLSKHSKILNKHSKILNEHSKILSEHSKILNEHSRILNEHSKTLVGHSGYFISIENTLKFYGDMYKMNRDQILGLSNRVDVLESA